METIAFLQQFTSPALDRIMLAITDLGDEQAYIALLVIIYLAVSPTIGRRVGIVLMLSFYLNFHLKGLVDTPRPFAIDPSVARSEAAMATAPGAGFPSGHAQGAATFWGYLALLVRRPWCWVLAATVVTLVSLSRLYLGLHVPIDIIGGLAIAAAVIAMAYAAGPLGQRLAARYASGPWPAPPIPLLFALGLLVPLGLHLLLPVADSALLMGGLAAFITAPVLIRHQLPPTIGRRTAASAVGLVLVFAALLGSSRLLPEVIKTDPLGGFTRYLLIGYVGLALTPYLVRWLGLAPRPSSAGQVRG